MRSVYMATENLMQSILNASWGIYLVFVFIFIFMKIPKRKSFCSLSAFAWIYGCGFFLSLFANFL